MATRSAVAVARPRGKAKAKARAAVKPVRWSDPAGLLMTTTGVLVLVGLVMILSASLWNSESSPFQYFNRQVLWAALGLVGFFFFARFDYKRLKGLGYVLLPIVVLMLMVVLIPGIGTNVGGSSRWFRLGPLSFQPSEAAKLALILFAADVFSRKKEKMFKDFGHAAIPMIPVLGLLAALVMLQPDLGTTALLGFIGMGMLFVAGARIRHMLPFALLGTALAVGAALFEPYRRARVLAFLNPWADPLNTGYHTIQSLIALGSGGWFGVGLGASRQKWTYVPNAHTDFIFAIFGEEMGLLGTLMLVGLFGFRLPRDHDGAPGLGPLRHARRGRHHDLDNAAGPREHGRGDRRAPGHRGPAPARVVRRDVARDLSHGDGDPHEHRAAGAERLTPCPR